MLTCDLVHEKVSNFALEMLACDVPLAESIMRVPGHQRGVANKITETGSSYKLAVIWVRIRPV